MHEELQRNLLPAVRRLRDAGLAVALVYGVHDRAVPYSPVHSKQCVIDESVVLDGSFNWYNTSVLSHDLMVVVNNRDVARLYLEEARQILDGFRVQGPKQQTLDTAGYAVEERDMPLQYELLQILVNPNVAFLLLLIGFVGIALEAAAPGTLIPGTIGAVALVLGLIGTLQLPVAALGVILLIAGFILVVAEAHLPTGGLLGVAGIAALVAGGLLIFDTGDGAPSVSPFVAVPVAILLGGATVFVGQRVLAARRLDVRTGEEELVGSRARVRTAIDPVGQVFTEGALWRARSADGNPIELGAEVEVEQVDGLTLVVHAVAE